MKIVNSVWVRKLSVMCHSYIFPLMVMMKTNLAKWVATGAAVSSLMSSIPAFAYGSPGFPPGLPTYDYKVICSDRVINLPFGRTITIPQCRVQIDDTFHERLRDFLDRIIHGDNR